jgi:hypothetical protein
MSSLTMSGSLLQQRLWMREQVALGEFEHHLKSFTGFGQPRMTGPGDVYDGRLGIDQQQAVFRHVGAERGTHGRIDALLIESIGPTRSVRE